MRQKRAKDVAKDDTGGLEGITQLNHYEAITKIKRLELGLSKSNRNILHLQHSPFLVIMASDEIAQQVEQSCTHDGSCQGALIADTTFKIAASHVKSTAGTRNMIALYAAIIAFEDITIVMAEHGTPAIEPLAVAFHELQEHRVFGNILYQIMAMPGRTLSNAEVIISDSGLEWIDLIPKWFPKAIPLLCFCHCKDDILQWMKENGFGDYVDTFIMWNFGWLHATYKQGQVYCGGIVELTDLQLEQLNKNLESTLSIVLRVMAPADVQKVVKYTRKHILPTIPHLQSENRMKAGFGTEYRPMGL
ncbi:hypothetical protein M427DRAFT_50333 [Gonapodya prolifera JEL478]|uniref:Uncharacterized protein n=1 Tax=Gonapodya prolifera (strain JEL478) TaxID=1344416 RepID=A0A138ZWX0_GONPJ|nr:hypothetical protein M427DRAFT_50333 [Gonapodya prolifera JEL478]|eukprot:KXS08775.1 hypothetical protein M427DRAFT_50333 [Gonapodya prolifera JEL478]